MILPKAVATGSSQHSGNSQTVTPGVKDLRFAISIAAAVGYLTGTLATLALAIGIFTYLSIFFFYPMGYAAFDRDWNIAIDIAKWNGTHFPPTLGPALACEKNSLDTPRANTLRERTLTIGRQLEAQHSYTMTEGTIISIVSSLGEHAGIAHSAGGESCIQIALHNHDIEHTIRHEWAHIAAARINENAAHGPLWQTIANEFDVNALPYISCQTGDFDCKPTLW